MLREIKEVVIMKLRMMSGGDNEITSLDIKYTNMK
jgi:hypothetical protein